MKNSNLLFEIDYFYDMRIENWKLTQADKILNNADFLKNENINLNDLKNANNIIDDHIAYIFAETIDIKNNYLLSSINYSNSIIKTTIRSLETNNDCKCTTHPSFLVDKSFFNCQEDNFYDVNKLKIVLNE